MLHCQPTTNYCHFSSILFSYHVNTDWQPIALRINCTILPFFCKFLNDLAHTYPHLHVTPLSSSLVRLQLIWFSLCLWSDLSVLPLSCTFIISNWNTFSYFFARAQTLCLILLILSQESISWTLQLHYGFPFSTLLELFFSFIEFTQLPWNRYLL